MRTTINITEEHNAWLNKQSRGFNFSKLIRKLLDKHIIKSIKPTLETEQ